ncbi:MAG: hypothetical protein WCL16_14255, partial [bacterium]
APGGTLQVNNLNALSTNSLVVSNGTLRIPTGLATIGNSAGYRSALVSGSGSLWTNGSALTIGSNAQVTVDAGGTLSIGGALIVSNMGPAANGLIVTNGGMLFSTAASFVGNASSNNSMLVAGGGALWNGGAVALTVGNSATATNNLLRLDGQGAPGGAVVTNLSTLTVGAIAGADRNGLIVGNGGRIFTAGAAVIGTAGSGNYVRVQGPAGSLWNAGNAAVTVGSGAGARNNALVIDGNGVDGGSVVTNTGTLNTFIIGSAAAANSVIITNGGRLFTGGAATIGNAGSTGNYVRVEGGAVTSLWNAGNQTLTVGSGANAIFNTLTIDGKGVLGSAVVTNASKLFVNYNAQSGGGPNLVLVTNQGILSVGTLCVGYNTADSLYSSSNNVLEIAQGGQVFASNNIAIGGALNEIYKGHHSNNRLVVRDANSVLDMRNSSLTIAFLNSGSGVYTSGFNQVLCDGGLITNMGATTVGCTVGSNDVSGFNGITVTNGGRIYSRGAIQVAVNYQSNDWITITGTNSIWDAGGSNLTVGTSIVGNSDNAVLINNSGTLDAIGTLTLAGALNYVNLRGGTLGVA